MAKYVIEGRKWFDKMNGNTYHSVRIYRVKDNELIYNSGMTYGYGDQYRHTAYDWLVKKKLVKEKDRSNHALNRKRFLYIVKDVLKRDL